MKRLIIALFLAISCLVQSQDTPVPGKYLKDPGTLANYLVTDIDSQEEQVRAIHKWITENIEYDYAKLKSDKCFRYQSADKILSSKKAICTGYSELMYEMCREVGIESERISGYVRSQLVNDSTILLSDTHMWVAVKIDNQWRLADPTWDAGYIGRIPIVRPPYKIPEFKEREYKTPEIEQRAREKHETMVKRVEEREANRKKFKNKVGFVSAPSENWFLVPADTFLTVHLPNLPFWQLRDEPISPDDFKLPEKKLVELLPLRKEKTINFDRELDQYGNYNILDKMLIEGDLGYLYNTNNARLKALNYYNFLSIINDREVRKLYKNIPEDELIRMNNELLAVTDTMLVYNKVFNSRHKEAYIAEKGFYNVLNKEFKSATKLKLKLSEKGIKMSDKSAAAIEKHMTRQEAEMVKLATIHTKLEDRYKHFDEYVPDEDLDLKVIQHWLDSLQQEKNILTTVLGEWNLKTKQPTLQSISYALGMTDHLVDVNNSYFQQKTVANIEYVREVDSLSVRELTRLETLYSDSLPVDMLSKEAFACVKRMQLHIRNAEAEMVVRVENHELHDGRPYIKYMNKMLFDDVANMYWVNDNAIGFNEWMLGYVKSFKRDWEEINLALLEQQKLNEERHLEMLDDLEADRLRNVDLYENIRTDGKRWKADYKAK